MPTTATLTSDQLRDPANLVQPQYIDLGIAALHNMPCSVCNVKHAVINLGGGAFEPCWTCQDKGFKLVLKKKGRIAKFLSHFTEVQH